MRSEADGFDAKSARAPWPKRGSKRLDSGRSRLENLGASFAKRSKLTRSMMSACSFGKMSVANAGRGTSEGRPSRYRTICSLLDRITGAGFIGGLVWACGGWVGSV
jgi:hypothetical protein